MPHSILDFEDIGHRFPHLKIGEVLADAGEGIEEILDFVYTDLHAVRLIDLHGANGDDDPRTCLARGHDANGIPLCQRGYRLTFNGHDYKHRDSKFVCRRRCLFQKVPDVVPVPPPDDPTPCPFLESASDCGQVVRIGRTLPGGNIPGACLQA